ERRGPAGPHNPHTTTAESGKIPPTRLFCMLFTLPSQSGAKLGGEPHWKWGVSMTKTWKISQTRRALSSLSLMALLLVALLGLTAGCSAGPAARDPAVQPPAAGHEASLPEGFPEPPDWFEVVP